MHQPVVKISHFTDIPEPAGLKDEGHVFLTCSACGKPLVDIWCVKKDVIDPRTGKPFVWKVQALCCYCGDKSFPVEVQGRIVPGCVGIDIPNPDPDEAWDSKLQTKITRTETTGDTIIFHTTKAE
jgi:hypothetical protein